MCKKASHVMGQLAIKMYKGFLGYMFSNLINAVFSYNLKWSLSSHYFSFVCKRNGERKRKSAFFSFIRIQHCKYLLKDMVLEKSDQKETCCLVAVNNTAGLHVESSVHIPKSVLLGI